MVARPSPGPPAAPLSIEPAIGWRAWCIEWDGEDGVSLTSPMQAYDWRPMQPNRAGCHSHSGKQVPNLGCGCGFYAVSSLERLPMAVGPTSNLAIGAVGSVAMWGRVVEHAAGYRGQLAYPDRIRLVCGRCLLAGRKPSFSVCWLDVGDEAGPPLDVLRLPGVHLWDLAR